MSAHDPSRPRVVALYLPHFYPIPENASASGQGFTDWQLVAQAAALFRGHDQPRRPADLGYCDLRVPEVRLAQADLARAFGIDAFCYGHYWFEGRRLFERPFAEVLAAGAPDFPFCLCWMNETWSPPGANGRPELRLAQTYSRSDDLAHAIFLAEAFADPRYLRLEGRPIFVVRRPEDLADPAATLGAIREAAARRGSGDPLLLGAGSAATFAAVRAAGFDVVLDWPHESRTPVGRPPGSGAPGWRWLRNLLRRRRWLPLLTIEDERRARARAAESSSLTGRMAMTLVGWDDTPGRGRQGTVFDGRAPELFEGALQSALQWAQRGPETGRMVFLYAWNAWLEGASLEPDERFGRAFLASVARARIQATRREASG